MPAATAHHASCRPFAMPQSPVTVASLALTAGQTLPDGALQVWHWLAAGFCAGADATGANTPHHTIDGGLFSGQLTFCPGEFRGQSALLFLALIGRLWRRWRVICSLVISRRWIRF